ncbi:helix-turn-helix domain-containing protein [Streptomyces sp. NPDC050549]|uniref:helix-turn-helix domain-containing protein n=1 Tax=Streptomyces sp. NPDC050549 TaxID=3155406 RepID=UPI003431A526
MSTPTLRERLATILAQTYGDHPPTELTREPTRRIYLSTTATGVPGIDFLAIERVVNADLPLPGLNEPEQELAARLMTRAELGADEIAERLRVEPRTVTRWRSAWKEAEGDGS